MSALPRTSHGLLEYVLHDSISRGGGCLGMAHAQDPVDLPARGALP